MIAGKSTDRAEQARLLFEWVARNIRYVGVSIGSGKLTPTPAAQTLRDRYGDCKASVALLAALMAARGIPSEPALINITTARYVLPDVAVAAFDHVILYLPEFDRYIEPTAQNVAFGMLPWRHYDKPVVHAVDGRSRTARVPRLRAADHTGEVHTTATVWSDGKVTGSTREIAHGAMATDLKNLAAADVTTAKAAVQLRFFGTPGTGKWTKSTRGGSTPAAEMTGEFTLADELDLNAGEALLPPPGLRFLARPGVTMFGTHDTARTRPFVCHAGRQVETIEVIVPPGLRPTRLPVDRVWQIAIAEYRSSYMFREGTLLVRREFVARPEGQVCTPEQSRELVGFLSNIRRDQRSVVVFDRGS